MIARALAWLLLTFSGKEERTMLVRLYAGEIIMGKITEGRSSRPSNFVR